jgi:hypothetical protein
MPCHPVDRIGRRVSRLLLVALLVSLLVPVARASAGAFTAVEQAYATSPSQTIPPCKFSPGELAQAESSVPNDAQQYDQNLIAAIEQARQARANGACKGKKRGAGNAAAPVGTPAPPPAPPLSRGTPLPVGSATAATDAGLPAPITILAVLAALALIGGAAIGISRLRGLDPAWVARSGHSWREAGYRLSGVWSEFGDWLRGLPH